MLVKVETVKVEEERQPVKYPGIEVKLVGTNGNAFAIIGAVKQALRRGGVNAAECLEFFSEATSGDYDHVLQTCMKWVTVK